jgi:hypothetical protein
MEVLNQKALSSVLRMEQVKELRGEQLLEKVLEYIPDAIGSVKRYTNGKLSDGPDGMSQPAFMSLQRGEPVEIALGAAGKQTAAYGAGHEKSIADYFTQLSTKRVEQVIGQEVEQAFSRIMAPDFKPR